MTTTQPERADQCPSQGSASCGVNAAAAVDHPLHDGEDLSANGDEKGLLATKSAEEALRASELRYRELVEAAHEGIAIIDQHGLVQFVNHEVTRMYGYTREELLGRAGADFVHPDDRQQLINSQAFCNRDVRLVRKNGSIVWTTISRSILGDGRQLVVIMDISERKKTEDELRASTQQQIALAQFARRALAGASQELLQYATDLVLEHLDVEHCSLYELDQSTNSLVFRAGDRFRQGSVTLRADRSTQAGYALAIDGAVIVDDYATERRFSTAQFVDHGISAGMCVAIRGDKLPFGTIGAFTLRPRKFTDNDARFLQSLADALAEAIERDVAQRALVASEERYRAVVEGASEVIYTIDVTGAFTTLNAAFGRVTGWNREEWIGRPFMDIVAPEDRQRAMEMHAVLVSGKCIDDMEFGVLNRDGSVSTVRISARPMFNNGRVTGLQGFCRDVTQAKLADAERARLQAQLEQASRLTSLGRLAATIAHEFNNVLMGISPFLEVLRRPNTTPERRATALDHMSASMKRGKRVTEEILRYTRPAPPVIERVDVAKVQKTLLTEVKSVLSAAYEVTVAVKDPSLAVMADASQLHQTLSRLVLNARDATPEGGPISIVFERPQPDQHYEFGFVSHPERFVHISVTDSGCGIAPETLRHIFEPLFTTKRTGTGLGLAVTHQVVKDHGGELFVESTEGVGSTFHLFLPAAEAEAATSEAPREPQHVAVHTRRVLLVEDDVNVASGIAVLLQEEGIEVQTVTTGGEVMPAIRRSLPDVVILDVGLPDIDGTTVYAEIVATHPGLPVVFSTGHGDERKIAQHLTRGNVTMLLKPYSIATLLETMARVQQQASALSE